MPANALKQFLNPISMSYNLGYSTPARGRLFVEKLNIL